MTNIYSTVLLYLSFIPFIVFVFLNAKANVKKEQRCKQFFMPFVALVASVVMFLFMNRIGKAYLGFFNKIVDTLNDWIFKLGDYSYLAFLRDILSYVSKIINDFLTKINPVYVLLVLFNVCSMLLFLILKKTLLAAFASKKTNVSQSNQFVSVFYDYDEKSGMWYIRENFGQAKTFIKVAYYATAAISAVAVFVSFYLCSRGMIIVPFYPVFPLLIMGEVAFFIDGVEYSQLGSTLSAEIDNSRHITNYAILRKKLKDIFGDKLCADGTTVNNGIVKSASVDQILDEIVAEYGKSGENYAMFIKKKTRDGFKPGADYVRSGIELASGKSLLFNTPFYNKLSPYLFYALHDALLKGGKVLIVLGRHGTEDDIISWCNRGFSEVTGLPSLWSIKQLGSDGADCDIGIVTRSGVHDLQLHRANREFLSSVSFVFLVEPSRLVTTAQIGLNLLVGNISVTNNAVYCSVDKNCDGLVDSLSHILMTNITEVSATEFPEGTSSYMCWKADNEHLQHRLTTGISRYLGMGTEISFSALKNQVENAVWYGGDAYPVLDQHWIAKQYYHDLLSITSLPSTQETYDKYFKVSFNQCNEQVRDNSFITVEDEAFNLFEVKRVFSTISKKQGFVNVISSDYMLRDYMTENNEIFTTDPKAIPYISADYARTARNIILKIFLRMSILGMRKEDVARELMLAGLDSDASRLREIIWKHLCEIYCENGEDEIAVETPHGLQIFTAEVISCKREYSLETSKFEDIFRISDIHFRQYVIDDLQNARYIAEKGNESTFLGTELRGHILQKYLPGQFITLNGKYYEMLSLSSDNQVIIRRAADHITARYSYRQIRKINLQAARDNDLMGALRSINGVKIYNQFATFTVDTPSYWTMRGCNDFETAKKVIINGVPQRKYVNKHILKIDFSEFGEKFTDEIRVTLTVLLNEVFQTMFAENQPYIYALTKGEFEKPLTYSLEGDAASDNCIYIVEDSLLDIGLLVSVERNLERIMHIISDYLAWNKSVYYPEPKAKEEEKTDKTPENADKESEDGKKKKKNPVKSFFGKIGDFFKNIFGKLFGKKKKNEPAPSAEAEAEVEAEAVAEAPTDNSSVTENSGVVATADAPVDANVDSVTETESEPSDVSESGETAESTEATESPEAEETTEKAEKTEKKRKGLFGSLFGRNKKNKKSEDTVEPDDDTTEDGNESDVNSTEPSSDEDSFEAPTENDAPDESAENTASEDEADTESTSEDNNEAKPEKSRKSLFGGLFGGKKKAKAVKDEASDSIEASADDFDGEITASAVENNEEGEEDVANV